MDIREYLKDNILLFDGGMGTYYEEKKKKYGVSCELANLSESDTILKIHREYIEAGCKAIKTNTFSSNRITYMGDSDLTRRVIEEGYRLATSASGEDSYVFADIGPISGLPDEGALLDEYRFVIDCFIECGAKYFLFETNSSLDGLLESAKYIKEKINDSFIILNFTVQADGYTREGHYVTTLLNEVAKSPYVDASGLNCGLGAGHMDSLIKPLKFRNSILSFMPNAGYPVVLHNRVHYDGDPRYFAEKLKEIAEKGGKILGGCCGTTPLHMKEAGELLKDIIVKNEEEEVEEVKEKKTDKKNIFLKRLEKGKKVIAVELDPPLDTNVSLFMEDAALLKSKGIDIITIADCPVARARMDSSILACKVKRELKMNVLPHLTCRDRNLNATKALLMGLYAEDVRNVLLVTGDPVPTAERDEVKSVYQFNSRKLASFVGTLNDTLFPTELSMFGALNINAKNFDIQLKVAKEKEENGMIGFLTQPVLTPEAFENLKRAKEELKGYILGGIIPVVSAKNARYMDSEVNGIKVDKKIIDLYEGKSREEGEALAKEISIRIAKEISPYIDGYYFMIPFRRTNLICDIIDEVRNF